MVSKFYAENCERTNEWLRENAPEYVIKCVRELADITLSFGKRTTEAETLLQLLVEDENGK
ncbi:hypothetical protein LCGC14_1677490 [marine sediment metagenome]|uniref:Uncharacterized protein n=1 Tax=marine sediment metagenome TaxID=412755 RepID=A0A0F9KPI1_9ZZZZ